MLKKFIAFASIASVAASANAAIILQQSKVDLPKGGLVQYTITAVGTAGESINTFSNFNLTGNLHQVHGVSFGPATPTPDADAMTTVQGQGTISAEALAYDTRFLFGGADLVGVVGARLTEPAIGTSTAATLGLPQVFGQNQPSGYTGVLSTATGAYGLTPAASGSNLAFMQIVLPAGETASLSVTLDAPGVQQAISNYVVGAVIPEPTTCVLAGLALVGAAARRRV